MEERAVRESQVVLSQSMGIEDANLLGFVHGGVIMKLVDNAAGLVAIRHSRGPVVTAAVDEMSFIEPVQLGALVTVAASLNYVGTTSMEVGVRVETEDVLTGERAHTASAYLVFVALEEGSGKPRPVPRLIAETPDEKRRMREAGIRRDARLARRRKILEARAAGEDAV
ncbi:MAG TPA: acyl-CoA thioesterase [Actinomycetota bacterium]|nr:acyl-CoA thioesterase [Actinomycetota bacterium]